MSWVFFSLIAQLVIGTAAVFDKILLKRKFFDPWVYTFWFGIVEFGAILLIPFGFITIPFTTVLLALFAGALFILATFFLYTALSKGEASHTLPAIGALSPLATLLVGGFFLKGSLDLGQYLGFFFLVIAAFILLLSEKKKLRVMIGAFTFLSAFSIGAYNILAKLVFLESPFLTGFIWIKLGGTLTVLLLFLVPALRKRVYLESGESKAQNRFLYFSNRGYAAIGSIVFTYALSLTHPALAEATQSFRFVIILLASWLLLRERFKGSALAAKSSAILLVIVGIALLGSVEYGRSIPVDMSRHIEWGITFSDKFSKQLGLDWRENFTALLQELHPRRLRLIAYWDEIEKTRGNYEFSDLDWQLSRAREAGADVILVLGMKVPRWPECHIPGWASVLQAEERENELRTYIRKAVERYKSNSEIEMWQIENEPYLGFGRCPERGEDFLGREIALVKSLDSARKILVTDGGEFGLWYKAARAGNVFGTTMYREAYPKFIGPIFGVIDYHIDPSYFRLKEKAVRLILDDKQKQFIVIELQGEPWGDAEIPDLTYQEQLELFSPDYFRATIDYAKKAGFDEYYLWGAEWWYWIKTKQNNPEIWEIAKELISH